MNSVHDAFSSPAGRTEWMGIEVGEAHAVKPSIMPGTEL